ncbi:MAG TPA: hypothetical protein PLS90_11835 [Candidatus Sumerlaeota bacterium]|nr:hypothetical protein [Candidatus Sumerlaeota bacterium]HOR29097.1 hypothetical protein [Candidatus Sumerlaeota bacterium]HPK03138.1 hypothetical protein [Candidatus Sumerlaeota bacterium]
MLIEHDLMPELTAPQLAGLRNDLACLGSLPPSTQWELLALIERLQESRLQAVDALRVARETVGQALALLHPE